MHVVSRVPADERTATLAVDGTLLNAQHEMSEESVEVLRSISRRGIKVALCSGRSLPAIQDHAKRLGLPCGIPVVAYNGAAGLLASPPEWTHGASELFTMPVPRPAVEALLRVAAANNLLVQYYLGDDIYVSCRSDAHMAFTHRYAELTGVAAHQYVESYDDCTSQGLPYKM